MPKCTPSTVPLTTLPQWWVGEVVYIVVDTQRATEKSAADRANKIRGKHCLSMGRVKRTGKRSNA